MAKGLNEYRMTYLDSNENRQSRPVFATKLRDAVISAEDYIRKAHGFNCLLVSVEEVTNTEINS